MKTLLIIDVQNDFLPGGALAVPKGNEIIPFINELSSQFELIIATKDWHPPNHISFASRHGKKVGEDIKINDLVQHLWPDHCIQNTHGAQFPSSLNTSMISKIFYKGNDSEVDSYSAFFDNKRQKETGLREFLKEKGIDEIYVVGLATEFCVKYSVLDALNLGLKVFVLKKGCRGLENSQKALEQMEKLGAIVL